MVATVDHGTWQLAAADEGLHPPGPEPLWNESYYFDFAAPDGSVGGYLRLGLYPNWGRAWYWACLVRPGLPAIVVADNAAALPPQGSTGLKTATVTATQAITGPLTSARVTLDAMAAVAHPAGSLTAAEHVRLTADLEWITAGGVYPYRDLPRYEIPCHVTGTVSVGAEHISVAASGERDHSWGERDWWQVSWLWSSGHLCDGTAFHGTQANLGVAVPWPSFVAPPGGAIRHSTGFSARTQFGPDGLPCESVLRIDGAPVIAVPLAFAPVAMVAPDGRVSRLSRALCRFTAADGRTGYGWTEWNQPPDWREHRWLPVGDGPGGDE